MKITYRNEDEEFDFGTDIMHIRKGLEVINVGCCNDIGLYNPKVLLAKAIEIEKNILKKDFYGRSCLKKSEWLNKENKREENKNE